MKKIGLIKNILLLGITCSVSACETEKSIINQNMESTEINDKKIELNIKSPLKQTDKPKIVIVHAFGCVSVDEKKQIYNTNYFKDYDMLTNMLVEKGFKTVVINRLGYGKSDDSESPRTNENIVKEMYDALKKSNIDPPYILIGHSMGNLFCLEWIKSHAEDIYAYIGLDGTNPYYLPPTEKCPEVLDPKTFCPGLMQLHDKNLISDGMYGECLYQKQNEWNLQEFKFPEKMPVRMFLSKQLQNSSSELSKEWNNSQQLIDANKKLFSDENNHKIKCLDDGEHFLYRSEQHVSMIVDEIENILSKKLV